MSITEDLISFGEIKEEHIPLLVKWLNAPHVSQFWQESKDEAKLKNKFLTKNSKVIRQIIFLEEKPIGYIQHYDALTFLNNIDDVWPELVEGTVGIDQYIGEADLVNKGLGTLEVKNMWDCCSKIQK